MLGFGGTLMNYLKKSENISLICLDASFQRQYQGNLWNSSTTKHRGVGLNYNYKSSLVFISLISTHVVTGYSGAETQFIFHWLLSFSVTLSITSQRCQRKRGTLYDQRIHIESKLCLCVCDCSGDQLFSYLFCLEMID